MRRVRLVATSNITLGDTPTIDSVVTLVGDVVLVTAQTDATRNGLWQVKTGAWTHIMPDPGEHIMVTAGATYANTCWMVVTANPVYASTGSTPLVVMQMGGAGSEGPPGPRIRFHGVGATTNIFRVAIYQYSNLARLTSELAFTTAAATWGSATVSPALALTKDTLYFIATSVNATGTTAGPVAFGGTTAATTGRVATAPQSLPGNLDMDAGFFGGFQAQFAVTTGALPATAPTLAAPAVWTGGMPAFWMDNSSA